MIDYSKVKEGDILEITGMGAPGFGNLGDHVQVLDCSAKGGGMCKVRHVVTDEIATFMLTCGAQRLKLPERQTP